MNTTGEYKIKISRRRRLIEFLKDKEVKGRLLDIGCQNGEMCSMLHKEDFEVYGVDVDNKCIVKAKETQPQIEFKCADCGNGIPFPDEFFDIVWAGDVIEHICNTDIFINEINRVLKMGGSFVLSTPTHNRIKNIVIALFRFEAHFNPEFPHYRFYTLKSLKNVLENRGFKILYVKYIGRFRPFSNNMFVASVKISSKCEYSQKRY